MMREARGARSLLLRVQAAREKREADPAAADRAAWTEHCAIGLMAEALGRASPLQSRSRQRRQSPTRSPQPRIRGSLPERAALIRRLGCVPDNASFGPPEDYLVHALVTGRTPALLALDQETAKAPG